jgi:hypothetical protein
MKYTQEDKFGNAKMTVKPRKSKIGNNATLNIQGQTEIWALRFLPPIMLTATI